MVSLQKRVESLKRERYEARRDLERHRFDTSQREAAAEAASKAIIEELTDKLAMEADEHKAQVQVSDP